MSRAERGMEEGWLNIVRDACDVEALPGRFPGDEATALIYSPAQAFFARLRGGQLVDAKGEPVDLGKAFEVRLFSEEVELRWRRRGNSGEMVLLTESDADGGDTVPCWKRETHYLLWGGEEDKPGTGEWGVLSSAQIGTLEVPVIPKPKERRLVLTAREYFRKAEDGNVVFFTERLTGLVAADMLYCGNKKEKGMGDA